ncbi:MAG: hypothetical protein SFU91_08055 [Chloroherpetonaceae bacterium]|nr:hypothetical protein [Chloroherpetonaceae bacterium]
MTNLAAQSKKPKPVEEIEIEADDEYYGPNFTTRTGFSGSLGLTSRSYAVNFNYVKSFDPDWMFVLSFGVTSDNDPNERQSFDFFTGQNWIYDPDSPDPSAPLGRPPFRPKLNSLMMFPLTATFQHRLFRNEITRSFRPFIEFGAGPTFGYVYNWLSGFFDFSKGYIALGFNGQVGAGAYFGANPLMLQGLSVRYQFSYLPAGVQMLESKGALTFFGSISLNLTFGTLF